MMMHTGSQLRLEFLEGAAIRRLLDERVDGLSEIPMP
jgi:hypothetical protein